MSKKTPHNLFSFARANNQLLLIHFFFVNSRMQPSVKEIFPEQDMSRYVPATPTLPPLHSKTLCSALNWLHQRQKSTNYYFQMEVSPKNWGVKKKISKIYWIYWMVKSLFFFALFFPFIEHYDSWRCDHDPELYNRSLQRVKPPPSRGILSEIKRK